MASYILKQGGADDVILALGISIDFKKKQIHFDNGCSMGFINRSHGLIPK